MKVKTGQIYRLLKSLSGGKIRLTNFFFVCAAAFCSVDTDKSPELINVGVKYLKDGEKARLECVHQDKWWTTHYSVARCNNGSVTLSRCKYHFKLIAH